MNSVPATPMVDAGNPPGGVAPIWRLLAPAPGRLGDTIRLVVLVVMTVTISETFQMPEAALSAYVVLFVSRGEAASTIVGAAVAGMAVLAAILVTVMVFMFSLAEPALRIPLIALVTFIAVFLSRASALGPIFFAAGFIIAYGLTLGDEVTQLALAPEFAANVTGPALPELAFIPAEEALLHFMLWLGAVVAMPIALVIAANLLTGRDPATLLRAALAERLATAARFCAGAPGAAAALAELARQGTAELARLAHLAGVLHKNPQRQAMFAALVHATDRLGLVLLAWARLPEAQRGALSQAARFCDAASHAVLAAGPAPAAPAPDATVPASGRPLAAELSQTLQAIAAAFAAAGPDGRAPDAAANPSSRLLKPDSFTNPAYPRFAFKVTLAVMLCYIGESLADWPGIHTCIITCFFVALDTVGETIHKAALRIAGCVVGGALGIATILLLMPMMTDLGDLLAVIAAVTLLAGWIAAGSERIAYAGWQIALAFYLCVLQGSGPTLNMETARDRLVGIVVSNIVVFVIFTTIWPVRVADAVRAGLARALDQLAVLMQPGEPGATQPAAIAAFGKAIEQARGLLVNDRYEAIGGDRSGAPERITADTIAHVQSLLVPISVILRLHEDPAWPRIGGGSRETIWAHHRALAAWLAGSASWVRGDGAPGAAIAPPPPPPAAILLDASDAEAAAHGAARAAWYDVLDRDIRAILDEIGVPGHAVSA